MYILILLLTISFSLRGTISFLGSYERPNNSGIVRIAGEYHDADPARQRNIVINALSSYAQKCEQPLTLSIEDPLAIPGLEQIQPHRGILLGLTAQLQQMNFPSSIEIKNFDTKKAANCAIHFFSQQSPTLHEIAELNSITIGHLITELCQSHEHFKNHTVIENLGELAKKDCNTQLAIIQSSLDAFTSDCIKQKISPSDSIEQVAVKYAHEQPRSYKQLYDHLYQADVRLTSFAALIAVYESKHNMALLCGERHAHDVSRVLSYEKWSKLHGPCSFTDQWLLYSV